MNIAIIAHDVKKELMTQFCIAYCGTLSRHTLCATGTTGKLVSEATGLEIQKFLSGPQGGEQRQARADGYGTATRNVAGSTMARATGTASEPTAPSGRSPTQVADHLATLLPADAQLVVCTPAVDDEIVEIAAALRRR